MFLVSRSPAIWPVRTLPEALARFGQGARRKGRRRRLIARSSSHRSAAWCRPALRVVRKGGCVVCAGIHMSDIPSFPYSILWEERELRSVANLTRRDGEEFFDMVP